MAPHRLRSALMFVPRISPLRAFLCALFLSVHASATPGDINNDGTVDVLDRDLLIDHLMGISELAGIALTDADANGDGVVDIRDVVFLNVSDMDTDCLPDFLEPLLGLDPTLSDTDGNGTPDGDEDTDADGLTNCEEVQIRSDAANPDTDGDGFTDGDEVFDGSDPNDASSLPLGAPLSAAIRYRYLAPDQGALEDVQALGGLVRYRYLAPQDDAIEDVEARSAILRYRYLAQQDGATEDVEALSPLVRVRYLAAPEGAVANIEVNSRVVIYLKE